MIALNASHLGTGGKGDARTVCGLPRGVGMPALSYAPKFAITCVECWEVMELDGLIRNEQYDLQGFWV